MKEELKQDIFEVFSPLIFWWFMVLAVVYQFEIENGKAIFGIRLGWFALC
jgi:hypothetical protein